jgi:hypothetical protein
VIGRMADSQNLSTLRRIRDEIESAVAAAAALPDFESLQGAVSEAREAVRRAYAHVLGGRSG